MNEVKPIILKNRLKVLFVPPIICKNEIGYYITIKIGSNYENKKLNGMSHFLEHMMFKGTHNRSRKEITDDFTKIGSIYNASTSDDYTTFFATCHKMYWEDLLDIILDIYTSSNFSNDDIKLEKKVVCEEISMYGHDEEHVIHTEILRLLYGSDSSYGRIILGNCNKNVKQFTMNDILKFKKKYYTPSNTSIRIIGNYTSKMKKDILNIIQQKLKNIKAGKLNRIELRNKKFIQKGILIKNIKMNIQQTSLNFVFRTEKTKNKNKYKYQLISSILGVGTQSLLYQKLREEKGLSYNISCHCETSINNGFMIISVETDNKKVYETIEIIMEILRDMKTNFISEEILKSYKNLLNIQEELSLDTIDDHADYYVNYLVYDIKYETIPEKIKKRNQVSKIHIRNLCKKIFVNDGFVFISLGRLTNNSKLRKLLNF